MPKITALPNTTIPATDDLLPFVDVSGTPTTRKATVANLAASAAFGDEYAPIADPTFTGTVIVPAATAATHAAQVTAIDAATGRLAIGGIELGDTGWRDVSALLTAKFSGTVELRRIGNICLVNFNPLTSSADVVGNDTYLTQPVGFRPGVQSRFEFHQASEPAVMFRSFLFGDVLAQMRTGWSGARTLYGFFTYATTDAWPTTLPGTAV